LIIGLLQELFVDEIDRKFHRKARRDASKKRGDYDGRFGTRLEPHKSEKYKNTYNYEFDYCEDYESSANELEEDEDDLQ
jgi:hypothetical protein